MGIFGRVKNWWNNLSYNEKEGWKIAGIWFVDGIAAGSMVTAAVKNAKTQKLLKSAYSVGARDGATAAYKQMAEQTLQSRPLPYQQNDFKGNRR